MVSRILLVGGDTRSLDRLEACLRPLRHPIVRAPDARRALSIFERERPDLMVLDAGLLGSDGIDTLFEARAEDVSAGTAAAAAVGVLAGVDAPPWPASFAPVGPGLGRRVPVGRRDGDDDDDVGVGVGGPSRVPVILLTDDPDRELLHGVRLGADEILGKPIDAAVVAARARALLEIKRASDAFHASHAALLRQHHALLEIERAHRERTAFIVHDLKTPLSAMFVGLEWARGHLMPGQADLAEAIADASAAATRLGSMIGDLLSAAHGEPGGFPLHREAVRIRSLFEAVTNSYARRAADQGIALATWPDGDLEVHADPMILRRVLENILENAFRYTRRKGHIALTARRPWHGVQIAISNDGPPIPAFERSRIFEKFARGEDESPSAGNAGLGLYFCKRAVEAHGGAIDIVETPEWPTSFRISLP